jgi:DNA polymerase V
MNTSPNIQFIRAVTNCQLELPYISSGIRAGFPSPAMDFVDLSIDLNHHLIRHPSSTFCARVKGDSMRDAGISDGDLLIIDKSLNPQNNNIAVCYVDGEFTLKRLLVDKNTCWLMPENDQYPPIQINEDNDFFVWGILTYVIKKIR